MKKTPRSRESSGDQGTANQQPEDIFVWFNEINIIAQLSNAAFERNLPDDLTTSQFSVLNWFHRVDVVATPTRLARAFQVTGGAMTNTLKRLQQKGFIQIEPDPASGRQKKVTITAAGRRARARALKAAQPLFAELATAFDRQELMDALPLLQRMRRYLDEERLS